MSQSGGLRLPEEKEVSAGSFGVLKQAASMFVSIYWLVQGTEDKSKVNMAETTHTENGVSVPLLENSRAVKSGDVLLFWKPPAKGKSLSAAPPGTAKGAPPPPKASQRKAAGQGDA